MTAAARELTALLDREREAAMRADVEALIALQIEKRALVDALRGEPASAELSELVARAHNNVALMRHLVACLRGLAFGQVEPTYGANGNVAAAAPRALRGAL